jgi:hypothetical protein
VATLRKGAAWAWKGYPIPHRGPANGPMRPQAVQSTCLPGSVRHLHRSSGFYQPPGMVSVPLLRQRCPLSGDGTSTGHGESRSLFHPSSPVERAMFARPPLIANKLAVRPGPGPGGMVGHSRERPRARQCPRSTPWWCGAAGPLRGLRGSSAPAAPGPTGRAGLHKAGDGAALSDLLRLVGQVEAAPARRA